MVLFDGCHIQLTLPRRKDTKILFLDSFAFLGRRQRAPQISQPAVMDGRDRGRMKRRAELRPQGEPSWGGGRATSQTGPHILVPYPRDGPASRDIGQLARIGSMAILFSCIACCTQSGRAL
jgi:hypothetical protein